MLSGNNLHWYLVESAVESIVTTFSHNARGEIPQTVLLLCYKSSLFWTATLKAVFVIWKRVIFLLCPQLQVPLQRHIGAPKGHGPIFVCVSQFSGFFVRVFFEGGAFVHWKPSSYIAKGASSCARNYFLAERKISMFLKSARSRVLLCISGMRDAIRRRGKPKEPALRPTRALQFEGIRRRWHHLGMVRQIRDSFRLNGGRNRRLK